MLALRADLDLDVDRVVGDHAGEVRRPRRTWRTRLPEPCSGVSASVADLDALVVVDRSRSASALRRGPALAEQARSKVVAKQQMSAWRSLLRRRGRGTPRDDLDLGDAPVRDQPVDVDRGPGREGRG